MKFDKQSQNEDVVELKEQRNTNLIYINQFLQFNKFISCNFEPINTYSLVSKSSKFFVFFSPQDCDFCVHQLIDVMNKSVSKDEAIIIPLCYDIKGLRFLKKNYQTNFDFYTTCSTDDNWLNKLPTPFIAFVNDSLHVKNIYMYDNDKGKLKLFINKCSVK